MKSSTFPFASKPQPIVHISHGFKSSILGFLAGTLITTALFGYLLQDEYRKSNNILDASLKRLNGRMDKFVLVEGRDRVLSRLEGLEGSGIAKKSDVEKLRMEILEMIEKEDQIHLKTSVFDLDQGLNARVRSKDSSNS